MELKTLTTDHTDFHKELISVSICEIRGFFSDKIYGMYKFLCRIKMLLFSVWLHRIKRRLRKSAL
jgi:hypothetical protein